MVDYAFEVLELTWQIATYLSYVDITRLRCANRQLRWSFGRTFWEHQLNVEFGLITNTHKRKSDVWSTTHSFDHPQRVYAELIHPPSNRITPLSVRLTNYLDRHFRDGVTHDNSIVFDYLVDHLIMYDHRVSAYITSRYLMAAGYDHLVKCLLNRFGIFIHEQVLVGASTGGNIDFVRMLLSTTKATEEAVREAARHGHADILRLLISHAGNHQHRYCDAALLEGTAHNHPEIVTLTLELGADNTWGALNWIIERHRHQGKLGVSPGDKAMIIVNELCTWGCWQISHKHMSLLFNKVVENGQMEIFRVMNETGFIHKYFSGSVTETTTVESPRRRSSA